MYVYIAKFPSPLFQTNAAYLTHSTSRYLFHFAMPSGHNSTVVCGEVSCSFPYLYSTSSCESTLIYSRSLPLMDVWVSSDFVITNTAASVSFAISFQTFASMLLGRVLLGWSQGQFRWGLPVWGILANLLVDKWYYGASLIYISLL